MASKNGRKYLKDEDFEEEEIWGVMEERENSSPKLKKTFKNSSFYSSSYATKHASPRMIPKSSSSSSSSVVAGSSEKQSSAPLAIPDWSKIYGKASKKNKNGVSTSSWFDNNNNNYNNNAVTHDGYYGNNNTYNGVGYDNGYHHHHHDHHDYNHTHDHANGCYGGGGDRNDDDDGDDDDDDDMVPPHEFLARKLARSQISSFSVYEGIGRTLKGRDLSKVRNAILTKTGFLE